MRRVTSPRPQYDVIIAGGGVAGAALALALACAYDVRVLVVERRSGPGNINRGDSLLPAVTEKLAAWGALDRFLAAGARPVTKMQVFDAAEGLLLEAPLLPPGARHPYLVLPHPDIERVLVEAAVATSRVEVRYRCRVARLLEEGGRVIGAALSSEDGAAEESVQASLVVGADGASSTVRKELGVPLLRVPYDHSFFVIDMERPPSYEDAMRIELHPRGGVLVVPGVSARIAVDPAGAPMAAPHADRVAIAVLVRGEDEDLFQRGELSDKVAEIGRRSPLLAGRRALPKGAHLYKLSRGHAPRYVARGAALLGDAVHVTNPTAGQGMTMAIEDAAALAAHTGAALARGDHGAALDPHLDRYERERRPKTEALIRWSHWMSRFYAMGGPIGERLKRQLFSFAGSPPGRLLHQSIWSRVAMRAAQ
jgi:monooxygenase